MRTLLTSTAVALCLGATTVQADMQTYSTTGYWSSAAGTNDGGYSQCVSEVQFRAPEGAFGLFMLKYDGGHPDDLLVHIFKQDWNIPQNTQMRVALQVDSVSRMYEGIGYGKMVEIIIPANYKDPVTGEATWVFLSNILRNGVNLYISFPDGSEAAWHTPLNGSAAELGNLRYCMQKVFNAESSPSQPYGNAARPATQPYQRQQLPPTQRATQPYTPL